MDELLRMDIVSEQFANQPRAVTPESVEDISEEAMTLLSANGISVDDISAAIGSRIGTQQLST